jgi:hypothetical protein
LVSGERVTDEAGIKAGVGLLQARKRWRKFN